MRTTEEILAELDARFSNPISPVRAFASTPLAPPPPDPPSKKQPEFRPRLVATAQPKATKAAKRARQSVYRKKPCPHPGWHRVRGSECLLSCSRCRLKRESTEAEIAQLFPPKDPKPITHGTRTGYMRGCRLECCASVESVDRKRRYRETGQ